jgi:hypothetical protein
MATIQLRDALISDINFMQCANALFHLGATFNPVKIITGPGKSQKDGLTYQVIEGPVVHYDEENVAKEKVIEVLNAHGLNERQSPS